MKRTSWFTLRRVVLGLAVAAIAPATAQAGPADFWNYDPQTGNKIANSSPGVAPGELATLWSVSPGGTNVAKAPSVGDNGGYDLRAGIVSSFAIALVLAGGALLAIRHMRRAKVLPA
jgi:hypothetical protein